MRTTQSLIPRLHEMPTLAELPVTGAVSAKAVNAAIALTSTRNKIQRFVEAARYAKAIQCELARQASVVASAPSPAEALKAALHRLFMAVAGYFCTNLDTTMPVQVRGALARVYQASQGGRVNGTVLFVDLKQLGACEAICEPLVEAALTEAEQALLSMRIG
jgi:hypothetical protein